PYRTDQVITLSSGARYLCDPERRGDPTHASGSATERDLHRPDLRAIPEPPGAAPEPGDEALRGRAADAGHRPDPPHGSTPAPPRRADGRARPRHRPAHRRDHPTTQAGGVHHPARRAELP